MKNSGLAFIRIIIGILTVFAIVVIGYQLYKYNFVSIKTESATMGEIENIVKSTGLFFRDEKAIANSGYDFLDVIREEGERIPAGGIIARVYADEHSAMVQKKIRELEDKIAIYEEVISNSGSYQSAITAIDQDIYFGLGAISTLSKQGSAEVFDEADSLIIEIMKKKIASGDLVHYDKVLKELKTELKSLRSSISASVKTVTTPSSGYFSLGSDGLESQMNLERLAEVSVDNFDESMKLCDDAAVQINDLGKVVYDSDWYVAMNVPSDKISRLEPKDTVYIRIPSFGPDRIKCTVAEIRKNGGQSVLVLSSSIITDNILTLRKEDISLIVETHTGIQIRQSALRKVDGEDGVYVKSGLLLKYKKVKVLYNDGTNAIVHYDAAVDSGLRIYDQVVYKGSNLYSGKAVSDG